MDKELVSNCCEEAVKENSDICSKCGEHCEEIEVGDEDIIEIVDSIKEFVEKKARFERRVNDSNDIPETVIAMIKEDYGDNPPIEEVEKILRKYSNSITEIKSQIDSYKSKIKDCEDCIENIRKIQEKLNDMI